MPHRLQPRNTEFREEYASVDEEYALVAALVRAREAANLTQAELARRLGTSQSAIARLEGAGVVLVRHAASQRRRHRLAIDGERDRN